MPEAMRAKTVAELLRETRIEVAPGTLALMAVSHQDWTKLLEEPELSPRPDSVFFVLRDTHEVTLLIEEDGYQRLNRVVPETRVETGFRLVTLDIGLDWNVVGYLASVTQILADEGISVGAVSAFSRDHLLIKQEDLGKALLVLGRHTEGLC
ncbi:MAG TPA: ACT domain-containing protein [Pyrinomonadaceae bacterium]|nr:ACT domain-containing protein [Pyrinomonadaceae bacterium]